MSDPLGMRWVAIVSLVVASAGSSLARPLAVPSMRKDAQGCRMIVPADFGTGAMRWIGACPHGSADGPGVLRVKRDKYHITLFAGTMHEGHPVAGYLDTGSEATAGPSLRFNGANGLPTASREEAGRACAIAASGARVASDRLRSAGNLPSAGFYDDWAHALQSCLKPTYAD